MSKNHIRPSFFGKFFSPIKCICLDGLLLIIEFKSGVEKKYSLTDLSNFPVITENFFGAKLSLKTEKDQLKLSMLNRYEAIQVNALLDQIIADQLKFKIENSILFFKKHALNEYLRDSNIEPVHHSCLALLSDYQNSRDIWQRKLDPSVITFLNYLYSYFPINDHKDRIRAEFEQTRLSSRKNFYDRIESNPLTEQQRLAVIRNNDRNLVLAAAGTGKTSVMVAKALDLIDSGAATSEEILILAYNKAAATELQERLELRSKLCDMQQDNKPSISTFHALGRKILKDCQVSTYLSDFVDDPVKLEIWITNWLKHYIASSPGALFNFIELSYQPVNLFDFKSKAAYDAYVRDNDYRTLQGERVKGFQELLIANWLFMHNIEYEYEAPYKSKRRLEIGYDYRPDFHLKGTDIYLEHFGIDRNNKTRPDIDAQEYNQKMQSKRDLHQECKTTLLETYHYNWTEGKLEERLKQLMLEQRIPSKQKSSDEILEVLNNLGMITENAKRYIKCLQAIRVERLDKSAILSRLKQNKIFFASRYADLLDNIHQAYKGQLLEDDRIDFDDMIIRATELVKAGRFKPKWKFILVDEFQDISMARMELINTLIEYGLNPILTVVGDDWQSIYRFSGGKLELTTRFGTLVGSHSLTKLEKTYRYNNSIADTAGTFVMRNPEQYTKQVVTHTKVDKPAVYLLDSGTKSATNLENRIAQVVAKIRDNDPTGSIAILARYRYLLENAKAILKFEKKNLENIKFWTFHGSKGLEADYCILVGFFQGKTGFPNQNKEDAVVEALLPSLDTFPHSEERRLLYVALTRARHKSYIIADPMAPSEFIDEMLAPKYQLHIASDSFTQKYREIFKCPVCTTGYFKMLNGQFGKFYSCTTGSVCLSKPRICEKCGSPSLDTRDKSVCNNPNCKHTFMICDRCGRPMRLRDGKFGKFWGCSGYGIKDDQCKHTRKFALLD